MSKTVIQMAKEAGFPFNKFGLLQSDDNCEIDADQMLERLVELARADERAKLAEQPAPVVTAQEPVATITPLMEQQMFDDWCPYKGNPDPRTVWAAAVDAVNGLLLGATPPAPAAPVQEPVAGLSETQAKAILVLALDLEKTGRAVETAEGQVRTDFVNRNRNIQCALADALRNATTPQARPSREWVRLTNAQWQDILDDNSLDNIGAIKNAIGAKLKENNT